MPRKRRTDLTDDDLDYGEPLKSKTVSGEPSDEGGRDYAPLVQQVPAVIKSNADAKAASEAAAKAVEHGNDPKSGLLGYDAKTWIDIHKRNAKGLRTRPPALANLDDKAGDRDKNRRQWQDIADTVWKNDPDLTKRDAAKVVAGKTGGSWRWIERHISKK